MRRIIAALLSALCLLLAGCGATKGVESDYPGAIMVDGVLYYSTVKEIPAEIYESAILGYADSYTDGIPTKDGQINFNQEAGNAYARVEDGIAVLIDHEWVLFEAEGATEKEEAGTIFFYSEATKELSDPEYKTAVALTSLQATELKALIDGVEEWVDDYMVDRLPYYFVAEIQVDSEDIVYYICDAYDMVYYDHHFGTLPVGGMQYICDIAKENGITVELNERHEADSFSYSEDLALYKEGDPGIKFDGFINVEEYPVPVAREAIERAKNECTIEYDETSISLDESAEIWKVVFSTADTLGGCQTVYLNSAGITQLIVYGE